MTKRSTHVVDIILSFFRLLAAAFEAREIQTTIKEMPTSGMWANHVMQIEGIPSQTLRDFVYAAYVEAASRRN